jgi:hypothetical protein
VLNKWQKLLGMEGFFPAPRHGNFGRIAFRKAEIFLAREVKAGRLSHGSARVFSTNRE